MDKERIFDFLLTFYISRKDKITCKQYPFHPLFEILRTIF